MNIKKNIKYLLLAILFVISFNVYSHHLGPSTSSSTHTAIEDAWAQCEINRVWQLTRSGWGWSWSECRLKTSTIIYAVFGTNGTVFANSTDHIFSVSCAAGEFVDGQGCVVACATGAQGTFAVLSSSDTQALTIGNGSVFTVNFDGCVYDYGISDSQGCYYEPAGSNNLYCVYTGTQTLEGSATIDAVTPLQTSEPPLPDNCIFNGTKLLCENSPDNPGCGSISSPGLPAQDVCFNDESMGCVSYDQNGVKRTLCAGGQKNCGLINGEYVCATEADGSGVNNYQELGCLKDSNGDVHCITNDEGVRTNTTTTTTDNGDGTSTQTTTTSNNVLDSPDYSTTSTIDNATLETTSTESTGTDPNNQQQELDLSPVVGAVNQVETAVTGLNTNFENAFSFAGVSTDIDSTGSIASLDGEAQSIIDGLGTDQVSGSDFLSTVFNWPTGTCTTIPFVYSHATYGLDLNYTFDPCSKLAVFRAAFGWFLYIVTVYFIFGIATRRTA